MEPGDLQVEVVVRTERVVLRLSGAMDTTSAGRLVAAAERLVQQGHRHLTLDCEELEFCDSDGLRAIKSLVDRVQPDGSITVERPQRTLTRLLDLADLGDDSSFKVIAIST